MTGQACLLNSHYPNYWDGETGEERWPVTYEPSERLNAGRDTDHPDFIFSTLHDVLEVWGPSRRPGTLDRFSDRLEKSRVPGSELAIEWLQEKYSHNLATATKLHLLCTRILLAAGADCHAADQYNWQTKHYTVITDCRANLKDLIQCSSWWRCFQKLEKTIQWVFDYQIGLKYKSVSGKRFSVATLFPDHPLIPHFSSLS